MTRYDTITLHDRNVLTVGMQLNLTHGTINVIVKYPWICIALYNDSSLKRSSTARVNEGSHSFTCHLHVYPQVE